MASSNLHQHQDHEQIRGSSSFALQTPDLHLLLANNHDRHLCYYNQNIFMNCNELNTNSTTAVSGGVLSSQRDHFSSRIDHHHDHKSSNTSVDSNNTILNQKLGFQLSGNAVADHHGFINQHDIPGTDHLHLAKLREELILPNDYFPKLSEVCYNYKHNPTISQGLITEDPKFQLLGALVNSECKLQNNVFQASSFVQTPNLFSSVSESATEDNFGILFPATNNVSELISPYTSSSSLLSSSLSMELQDLDLLAANRLARSYCNTSLEDHMNYRIGQIDDQITQYNKMPTLVSQVTDANKRPNVNSTHEIQLRSNLIKRPRMEQRGTFSTFKVRKEKLGDRIAALQQLVSPFGKTDTASVLMEAHGYIKFLQDQVETLSVPYKRSVGSKKLKVAQEASNIEDGVVEDDFHFDLRSRGLCLVPLACTSYVTGEHGDGP